MSSLYLDYFGLSSPPFSITPDPGFFFEGGDRGIFIAGLLHASLQADGIVLVIGEVGSGKTLMSRLLLTRLPDNVDTVYLPNPAFSRDEIIDVIARDLGVAPASQGMRLESLQQELIRRHALGRQVLVLIDEAHAMPADSIEEVRRLSNLETDNCKLVQLVLCGQPELDTLLATPSLRQVRDRVVYRLILRNLSKDDASSYLDHRLRVAGWRGGRIFSGFGERLLLRDAQGRARRLNLIADKALLAAFAEGKKQVNASHVRLAIQDAGPNFSSANISSGKHRQMTAAWLFSLVITAIASIWLTNLLDRGAITGTLSAKPPVIQVQPAITALPHLPGVTGQINAPPPENKTRGVAAALSSANLAPASHTIANSDSNGHGKNGLGEFNINDLDQRIKQSYLNAQQQAELGSYAIRLSSVSQESKAAAFISVARQTLAPEQIYVRRYSVSNATWYVIYFGNLPTPEAADLVVAELAPELLKAKPIIRTWKEIRDASWSL